MSNLISPNLNSEERTKALNVELKVTVMRLQERLTEMEDEFVKLKDHYRKIKDEKLKTDAHNE